MRNISVEALQGLLADVQRVRLDFERARQSLIEYEIMEEEDMILTPWPSQVEARISRRIDAKQAQLDEYHRKRQASQ